MTTPLSIEVGSNIIAALHGDFVAGPQVWQNAVHEQTDPTSISAVVDAMYAMVSGPAGPRDWSLQQAVFHPDARQMRTGVDAQGTPWLKIMALDDYTADTRTFFAANDFYEIEIARRVHEFGNIAHVWSIYEARTAPDDATPERRGINSIQLFRDERGHWRIVSMLWDNERPGLAIDRNI